MRLVIAEKPSVAQSIAAVLGAKARHDGYLEGGGYIVSWSFGHLAELADAAVYNADYAKWTLAALPIVPTSFRFSIRSDKKKQFDLLRELLRRENVTEVVNACDAGREGELIFRTVYCLAGCTKPILRLWISSMEDDAIRSGFQQLKSGREYDGLHQSALCRAKADWLVGINGTRFFSLTYGRTLNIGRVMSPTLALLVQRETEISAFVPEPFYTVQLDCGFIAATDRMKDKNAADAIVNACKGKTATVQSAERKEKSEKAPALYDLTMLQRDANRLLGYTSQQTLDYLQALYEKKLCTYPRTDSRFLTDDMEDSVPGLVAVAANLCGMEVPQTICTKQVCSSKKVTDHHAIVPTFSAGKAEMASLPLGEREVLKLAAKGLLRAVDEPYRYAETVVTVECAGQRFTAKGKTLLALGWKRYEQEQAADASTLPALTEQQALSVAAVSVKAGKTAPPKHFTEDTLLAAMENACKEDNLKQMAQTVAYLQENELLDYTTLAEKAAAASAHFNGLSSKIKSAETRMTEIAVLRKHIVNYAKTRDTYAAYRKAGYSKKFLAEHESEIALHKAAKQHFDELGVKKLPTIKALNTEYAALMAEKKAAYADYRKAREDMKELLTAKANIDRILELDKEPKETNERPEKEAEQR